MIERWINAEHWYRSPWGIWLWLTNPGFREILKEFKRQSSDRPLPQSHSANEERQ